MDNLFERDAEVILTWRVQARHTGGSTTQERINLKVGDRLDFGIPNATGEFQPNAAPSIGTFEVSDQHLFFSNFTTGTTFVIENLEVGLNSSRRAPASSAW